ncbi:hypothetical protein PIB30_043528, partial [Stylosanthes scabra]|nr:hypothetical protein [Stylosanthes scabra]
MIRFDFNKVREGAGKFCEGEESRKFKEALDRFVFDEEQGHGAVVKGKVKDSGACAVEGDDGARTSTEVGASAKQNARRRAEYGEAQHRGGRTTVTTVTNG